MKKLIALMLAAMLCMAACVALAADLKIGAVMLGDETEGYTLAHMEGIKQAAAELGLSDKIVWKYKVPEDQTCYDSALDLVGQGCNLIISNSYGHQSYIALAAEEYPDGRILTSSPRISPFLPRAGWSSFSTKNSRWTKRLLTPNAATVRRPTSRMASGRFFSI